MAARSASSRKSRGRSVFGRRLLGFIFVIVIVGALGYAISHTVQKGYRELALPLRHDDIIRQQAQQKGLDPSLIAAVIYQESRFRPRESSAGAQGLMQILPATADFIAGRTGGTKFTHSDLATPQVNISYGAYYLKYLLQRYDGDVMSALAAYNAGEGNVDKWVAENGPITNVDQIPFPETREYVKAVLKAQQQYKSEYAKELTI
jgi:soluble lytic murein transglycosylase